MGRDKFEQAREIFLDLAELAADQRASALATACGDDEELRREVSSLLAASAAAEDFLVKPPLDAGLRDLAGESVDPQDLVGTRVGAYLLTDLIGVGGMGGVYRGERADEEFDKVVAVKLLRADLVTADLLARFQHERQVLANLEHPHIARLYDGGLTAAGQPFIVMEYVEGLPIDKHCDENTLDTAERLALFLETCRAVQHAHRNLVVHRDLKPGNILVDSRGQVKLLDFGIAEVIEKHGARPDGQTPWQQKSYTPLYGSPEQATNAAVTTATDVYSLGVVLRKLLTADPEGDCSVLHVDLSAIIEKSTRRNPAERYQSVEHLAEDLTRHLTHLPVSAVAPGFAYRSGKFLRRNRAGSIWALSLAALLVAATLVSVRLAIQANQQRELARQRFAEVRDLATTYLFEIHDELDTHGPTAARARMVTTGLSYLDALYAQEHDDPALARDIARGYFKIAALQGDPSVSSVGDPEAGLANCRRAMAIVRQLEQTGHRDQGLILLEAEGQLVMGNISRHFEDLDTAHQHYEDALALRAEAAAAPLQHPRAYAIHKSYGRTLERAAAFDEAIGHYDLAVAQLAALSERYPADNDLQDALLATRVDLGQVYRYTGEAAKAREALATQIPLLEARLASHPEDSFLLVMLGGARLNLGRALDQLGEHEQAAVELAAALQIFTDAGRSDPLNVTLQLNASSAHHFLGRLSGGAGDHEAELAHYQQMLAIRRRVAAGQPESLAYRRELATALDMTGSALRKLGRSGEALPLHDEANQIFRDVLDARPDDAEAGRAVAVSYYFLGQLHDGLAETAEARHCYQESKGVMVKLDEAGALTVRDHGVIEMLTTEIARCDSLVGR